MKLIWIRCLLSLSLLWPATIIAGDAPLTVFVVPQTAPLAIHKAWSPLLEKLGQATGLAFELRVMPAIPAFEAAIFKGEPDFAFMNPYHYILARREQGYIPLLRDSEHKLAGMLVVRKDSPIKSIEELNGKTVAFPAPNAFAASLYMRALLAGKHIGITPVYVKSHSNVYRSVLLQDVPAGGGVNNTFEREPADIRNQLRVLYTTPQSAPHPLAAHPRVAEAVRSKVTAAFIQLAADPANAKLFDAIQMPKPVSADYQRDYQALETLGLDKFFVDGGD